MVDFPACSSNLINIERGARPKGENFLECRLTRRCAKQYTVSEVYSSLHRTTTSILWDITWQYCTHIFNDISSTLNKPLTHKNNSISTSMTLTRSVTLAATICPSCRAVDRPKLCVKVFQPATECVESACVRAVRVTRALTRDLVWRQSIFKSCDQE